MSIRELQASQQPLEIQQLAIKFKEIENQLVQKTPELPMALVEIHKMLQEHEELTNILDDDDIMILHKAHELHKQFALIQKEEKKLSSRKNKKLSDSDFANL